MSRIWVVALSTLISIALITLALSLTFEPAPASAAPGPISLTGKVAGDANAKISLQVIKRKGGPKKIKAFRFTRLDHECTDGVQREYSRKFPKRIKIDRLLTGKFNFFAMATVQAPPPLSPGGYFVSGELKRSGRKGVVRRISSTIRFPSDQPSGETACTAEVVNATVRKR